MSAVASLATNQGDHQPRRRCPAPRSPAAATPRSPADATHAPANPAVSIKRRIPSLRNRDVYHEVVIRQRTKTDVAREFDLTQPRVTQICDQVRDWLAQERFGEDAHLTDEQRFNLAENETRLRLEAKYAEACRNLELSRQQRQQQRERRSKSGELLWTETTIQSGNPRVGFLSASLKATIELAKFHGIWGCGDAWAGRNRQDRRQGAVPSPESIAQGQARQNELETLLKTTDDRSAKPYEPLCTSAPPEVPLSAVTSEPCDATASAAETCDDAAERKSSDAASASELQNSYAQQLAKPSEGPVQTREEPPGLDFAPRRLLNAAARDHIPRTRPRDRASAQRKARARAEFLAPLRAGAA